MPKIFAHAPLDALKSRAKKLKQKHREGDPDSLQRVAAQLRKAAPSNPIELQHKHALLTVAREAGFASWQQAQKVIQGEIKPGDNFGEFWYSVNTMSTLNHWCVKYVEAKSLQLKKGGYLIPYKSQFAVVQGAYIEIIGLDTSNDHWAPLEQDLCTFINNNEQEVAYQHLVKLRLNKIFAQR